MRRITTVVIDDDPTGIQTVHGCLVLTKWDIRTLQSAFKDTVPFFFILSNSRALNPYDAEKNINEIVSNIELTNRRYKNHLLFISRSDSTLRSHFPLEINAIISKMFHGNKLDSLDAIFLCPAFFEGGRITKNDIHYICRNDNCIPTSDTEFAHDSVFGYKTSFLPAYIEEKTNGDIKAKDVGSVTLDMLRSDDNLELRSYLASLRNKKYVVVNAENYSDLNRFSKAILEQIKAGKNFIFQSGASLVKSITQTPDKPLIEGNKFNIKGNGIIIVGSYVKRSTEQLEFLKAKANIDLLELDIGQILNKTAGYLKLLIDRIKKCNMKSTLVITTPREEKSFNNREERLSAGQKISKFLAEVIENIPVKPAFIIAKGGITSHVVLAEGLKIERARVMGQILPGVPVIKLPASHRFGPIPFVIFPGNVGEENSLFKVYNEFRKIN